MTKAQPGELKEKISEMLVRIKDAEREINRLKQQQMAAAAGSLVEQAKDVFGVKFIGFSDDALDGDGARAMATDLRAKLGDATPSVVAIGGVSKGRPVVVIATNQPARDWRLKAGDLVKVAAGVLGGGGGGKPDLAQGGGQDASKLTEALQEVEHTIGRTVTN